MALRSLRAWHVSRGYVANVGDPNDSSEEVSSNEHKSEKLEKVGRESDGS